MRYFRIKTSEETLYSQYQNGENDLVVSNLIQYEDDIEVGSPVFILFGGDGTPWEKGLYGIAQIASNAIDVGYKAAKNGTYYKLKIDVKIRLSRIYEKKDFYLYPETMDSGIGPSTRGERNQALGVVDEKSAKAVCRAVLDKEPEKKNDFEQIFGETFIESVYSDVNVLGEKSEFDFQDKDKKDREVAFHKYLLAPGRFERTGTGDNYWKAMKKPEAQFVTDIIKEMFKPFKYDSVFSISTEADAEKIWKTVKEDPRNKAFQNMICSAFLGKYRDFLKEYKKEMLFFPNQKIFFGAPGTGKSFKLDDPNGEYRLKSQPKDAVYRTTFHPDYDYAQFVGPYKPRKVGDSITYEFVPQVFAKAYVAAYKNPNQPIYLVIEEINRGNCAQIFGDIFQLLDRDDNGYSSYEIDADADFGEWLKGQLDSSALPQNDNGDVKLKLPPNFNILATMNTSDQSLFPMDSAFKRRFDWEYVSISFDGKPAENYKIDIDGRQYSWKKFVESINKKIIDLTESEDKQLGEFFIKPATGDGDIIRKERFMGKVMFYLWNEVCKDEHRNSSFFRTKEKNPNKEDFFTYQDLYKAGGDDKLIAFMDWIALSEKSTADA